MKGKHTNKETPGRETLWSFILLSTAEETRGKKYEMHYFSLHDVVYVLVLEGGYQLLKKKEKEREINNPLKQVNLLPE